MSESQYIETDNELLLLQGVASGNKQAFEQLYRQYEGGLEKYVLFITNSKEVTEEIIQDVFLSIWQKREKMPGLSSFRGYLYHIARNRVISYLRSIKTRYKIVELDESSPLSVQSETDHRLLYNQYYKMALDAVDALPEQKKKIFRLSLEENLTLDEMARRLGISKSTVKQHLYGASAAIRNYLKKYGNIPVSLLVLLTLFKS
ncbi:MAG: RNA polymerase sigma-70 factor [Bacteroidota bacterium]|nr:RNA polymerase sigma-70 factor [Bacteroidota bacterium]